MKLLRLTVSVAVCAVVAGLPLVAYAQDPAALRTQLIKEHCPEIKTAIDQLQRRDLVSRTNLGREYENVSKQLAAFTQRVRNNNLDSKPYEQLQTQFNDTTSQFRDAYVHYDDSLNALQQINCQNRPADFDAQLLLARSMRDTAAGAVKRTAGVIGQYRTSAVQLQDSVPNQTANGSKP